MPAIKFDFTHRQKGVRYLFECKDANSKAPKYIQFSDHIIAFRANRRNLHIFYGKYPQQALLQEMEAGLPIILIS